MTTAAPLALIRDVTPAITRCELTHLARAPIDHARAVAQHQAYAEALAGLGCQVEHIPADPSQADAVFIEDTAVVFDELAVIARPGAASRRGETAPVAERLGRERRLCRIEEPATLDGGDVLRAGRTVFVGQTTRTSPAGVAALGAVLADAGYTVVGVPVTGCLHLKSAATEAAPGLLLLNPAWVDPGSFPGFTVIPVDPEEPHAANVLRVGDTLVQDVAYPRTRRRLTGLGLRVVPVDLSELAKAEGAVTCCSLIVPRGAPLSFAQRHPT